MCIRDRTKASTYQISTFDVSQYRMCFTHRPLASPCFLCSYRTKALIYQISKYRAFDVSRYRTCFAHVPWHTRVFMQIMNESFDVSNIEIVYYRLVFFCLSVSYWTRFRYRYSTLLVAFTLSGLLDKMWQRDDVFELRQRISNTWSQQAGAIGLSCV